MKRIMRLYERRITINGEEGKEIVIVMDVDCFIWMDQQRPLGIAKEYGRYLEPGEQAHWQWEFSQYGLKLSSYLETLARDPTTLRINIEEILDFLPKDSEEVRKATVKTLSDFLEKADEDIREKPQIQELRLRLNKLA